MKEEKKTQQKKRISSFFKQRPKLLRSSRRSEAFFFFFHFSFFSFLPLLQINMELVWSRGETTYEYSTEYSVLTCGYHNCTL